MSSHNLKATTGTAGAGDDQGGHGVGQEPLTEVSLVDEDPDAGPAAVEDDLQAWADLAMLAAAAKGAELRAPDGTRLSAAGVVAGLPSGGAAFAAAQGVKLTASRVLRDTSGRLMGELLVLDRRSREPSASQHQMLDLIARLLVWRLEQDERLEASMSPAFEEAATRLIVDAALTQFAAKLAHDLKSPLTAIIGFSELLASRPAVAADQSAARSASRISAAARRMADQLDLAAEWPAPGASA